MQITHKTKLSQNIKTIMINLKYWIYKNYQKQKVILHEEIYT